MNNFTLQNSTLITQQDVDIELVEPNQGMTGEIVIDLFLLWEL